jgi:uncharacterized membrane protein
MTEKIKQEIRLPVWSLTFIFTILVGLISFIIGTTAASQKIKDDIVHNARKIEIVEKELETKASKEKVDLIYNAVLRLETKIDNLNNGSTQHK